MGRMAAGSGYTLNGLAVALRKSDTTAGLGSEIAGHRTELSLLGRRASNLADCGGKDVE